MNEMQQKTEVTAISQVNNEENKTIASLFLKNHEHVIQVISTVKFRVE